MELLGRSHCGRPVLGLADDLVALGLEERPGAGPEARMIVDDQDCHTHSLVPPGLPPNTVGHTLSKRKL